MNEPSTNGANGRDHAGRFARGNTGGPGNPHARKIQQIRSALMKAIRPSDIKIAVEKLVEAAKAGDRFALAELLDRTIGRAIPMDVEGRLARLETMLAEREQRNLR